jgi:hypothetical protein
MDNTPAPVNLDLDIYQGQTFDNVIAITNDASPPVIYDLTGYKAEMMLRTGINDDPPVKIWSSDTGEIVIDGPAGTLTFNVSGDATQGIDALVSPRTLLYDLKLFNAASPPYAWRVLQGKILVWPSITRPVI